MDLDLSGVNRLAVQLASVGGAVGSAAAAVLRKSAADIERDAKMFAPVDTGALRNSISTDVQGDGRFMSIEAEIGPTVDYGLYVEEGTSTQGPAAYMGPAFDRHAGTFEQTLARIGEGIL